MAVCATMLAGNAAIQRLLGGLGVPATTKVPRAGTVEIRLDLAQGRPAAA